MLSVHVAIGLSQVAVHKNPAANGALELAAWADEEASEDLVLEDFLRSGWI